MNENAFKEGLKDIQYVKVKGPVFEIHAYNIKAGKGQVKIGGKIHVVQNDMFNWDFTISPFINGVCTFQYQD